MSQDNQIYSLKQTDGSTNWSQAAALEVAGVFGSASPAVGQGTVVAGFSSGELNAYRYENGRMVWQDALQRTSIRTSVSSLSDIDADPVIDRGQVIAIGQGGRMVALEINTGQRQWELNIAGISTPWVAGDWAFVITDEGKLLCVYRQNGHIRWINQLPEFRRPKSKKGEIDYSGPVLAGGRLIVTGSNGAIINLDPVTGSFQNQFNVGAGISLPPVVANNTLYIYDDAGRLSAYR
jgi:outer membrane protein assembly factor BamB